MAVKTKNQVTEEIKLPRKEAAGLRQQKTERRQAEDTLQESEERYRNLVESSPDGIVIVQGRKVVFANKVVKETSGYSEEELKKLDFIKLIAPSCRSMILKRYLMRLTGLRIKNRAELEVLTKQGRTIPCEISNSVVTYQGTKAIQATLRDISERKKAEEALWESERKYKALFENKLEGMLVIDAETMKVVLANQVAIEMYGFNSVEEIIGLNPLDFVAPEERERTFRMFAEDLFEKDLQEINEFRTITKDGKEKWISAVGTRITYGGKLAGLISLRDITNRKKAEQTLLAEQDKFQGILSNISAGVDVVNQDFVIEYQNEFLIQRFGDRRGEKCYAAYMHLDKPCEFCRIHEAIKTGKTQRVELVAGDGRDYELTSSRFVDVDGKAKVIEVVRDITEQKRVEKNIREAEKRFHDVVNNVGAWVWEVDAEGRYTYASPVVSQILGYIPQEMIGKPFYSFFHPDDRERLKAAALETFASKKSFTSFINRNIHKYGHTVILETSGVPLIGSDGQLLGYRGADQDVTEQRQAEKALRESEEKLKWIIEGSPIPIFTINKEHRITQWNHACENLTGLKFTKMMGTSNQWKAFYSGERPVMVDFIINGADEHEIEKYYQDRYTKSKLIDGAYEAEDFFPHLNRWLRFTASPIRNSVGETVGALETLEDITERKQAEEIYKILGERLQTGIYVVQDRKFQFVSPKFQEISGFSEDELLGRDSLEAIHSEDRQMVRENVTKMLKGQRSSPYEFRAVTKDGKTRWITAMVTSIQYKGERAVLGNYMDITERKTAEKELKASEERYRVLFETSPLNLTQHDREGRFLAPNPAMAACVGIPMEKLAGKKLTEVFPEEVAQQRLELIRKALDEWQIQVFEDEREGKYFHVIYAPTRIPGQEDTVQVIARDITEQKQAEEELWESEGKYRVLTEAAIDAIITTGEEGRILLWNRGAEMMFGYTAEEATGKKLTQLIVPQRYQERKLEGFKKFFKTGTGPLIDTTRELTALRKNGAEFSIEISVAPMRIQNEWQSVAIIRDITERKRAQEQLEHSFVDLAETVSRAMASRDPYTSDHQRRVAELARLVGEKMGLDKNRLRGLYIGGLLHDIGKVSTPESILAKPGKLSHEEWALIRAHAKQGYDILNGSKFPWPIADMAVHHHERLDGSGYPDGISGGEVSLEIRILTVCNVVEAMSSHRPYRPARSKEEVLEEIKSGRGTKYDANVVDIVLEIIESGEFDLGGEQKLA